MLTGQSLTADAAQETWRLFHQAFFSQVSQYPQLIHPMYRDHLHVLHAFADRIPTLADLKFLLAPIGWTARYVDGYTEPWAVARMLARRIMPVSSSIRPRDQIFFAREPDLIHDIFGHLPTLLDENYRSLLGRWAQVAARESVTAMDRAQYHLNQVMVHSRDHVSDRDFERLHEASLALDGFSRFHPTRVYLQDKIYFWIFEFGMVEDGSDRKVFGAGILSSLTELARIGRGLIQTAPLTVESYSTNYNISSEQSTYLVVSHLDQYDQFLDEAAPLLSRSKTLVKNQPEVLYV